MLLRAIAPRGLQACVACCLAEDGYCYLLVLDVSAATALTEWAWASAIGHGTWIADYALHGDLLLKLSNSGGLTLGLIGSESIEDFLGLGGRVGVDRGGVESAVVVDAIDCSEDVAAIVLSSRLFILDFYGFPP